MPCSWLDSTVSYDVYLTYTRSATVVLGREPNEVEAFESPVITVGEVRPVESRLLRLRALVVGVVWARIAEIGTPPLDLC